MNTQEQLQRAFGQCGGPFQFPGLLTTLAAATAIAPQSRIVNVTGTTAIQTITLPWAGFTGEVVLLPNDSSTFTTITGGNIQLATTGVRYKALIMTCDGTNWWPSY